MPKKIVKRVSPKAIRKAKKTMDDAKNKLASDTKKYNLAVKKIAKYHDDFKKAIWSKKLKYQQLETQAIFLKRSRSKARNRARERYNKAKKKYNKLTGGAKKYRLNTVIPEKIKKQGRGFNKGRAAIYPSSGDSSTVIFIAPTENENEDTQSNITSYAVDKGAPFHNYARVSSKTITVSGILTSDGEHSRTPAREKFNQLRVWNSRHTTLTYKGNIYYKHLLISDLQRSYSTFKYDIKVTITFTFVYTARVTSSHSKTHRKSSKSKKTLRGSRRRRYCTVTTKSGDTLWHFYRIYGKKVDWIQKVNHIPSSSSLKRGKKIRVR